MKKFLLILACVTLMLNAKAQTVLYEDDFESYTLGGYLAAQSDWWTTWSNAPGTNEDAIIVNTQSHSPTKSVKVDGVTDLVFLTGTQVSGKYQVDFYYYVPTGFGAYYNFQRFPSPGIEWILEVYFSNNGTGFIHAGGQNAATFTYPMNTWFLIHNIIDLDNDVAELYINNILIHTWQWSLSSQGAQSIAQFGGINIYAGAPTGQTPSFFFDDLSYIELESGSVPQVAVNPAEFMMNLETGTSTTEMLEVTNVGSATLDYNVEINYAFPTAKNTSVIPSDEPGFAGQKSTAMNLIVDQTKPGGGAPGFAEDIVLNYDGPNSSGVGYPNPTVYEVAARFPNSMTVQHAGMMLTKVDVYLYHTDNCVFKIRVYGEGNDYEPGQLKIDQSIAGPFVGWNTITLNTPIMVTGEDLWVGYYVAQAVGGIFPIGSDAGPANPNGHFIKPGVGWTVSNLDYNWNIRGTLTGNGVSQWLSISPATGSLQPDDSQFHSVTFNATQLTVGDYSGLLKVKSNDIANPVVIIPVTLDVVLGVNELGEPNAVMVYPNPTSEYIRVQANHQINEVKLFTSTGQMVLSKRIDGQNVNLEINHLTPGVYVLQVETEAGISNRKVMVY